MLAPVNPPYTPLLAVFEKPKVARLPAEETTLPGMPTFVPLNVKVERSVSAPPAVTYGIRPLVRFVTVREGVESAPVLAIVVVPVCPAAKVFAEREDAKKAVEDALVKESVEGSESVTLPSPSSVTVIWLAVPAIQLVSVETADTTPEPLRDRMREGVRDDRVVAPETVSAVVDAAAPNVCSAVQVFALPRLRPTVRAVDPS